MPAIASLTIGKTNLSTKMKAKTRLTKNGQDDGEIESPREAITGSGEAEGGDINPREAGGQGRGANLAHRDAEDARSGQATQAAACGGGSGSGSSRG